MKLLLLNIKQLVQVEENPVCFVPAKDMNQLQTIDNAFLLMKDEMILDFGPMEKLNDTDLDGYDLLTEIDCSNRMVFPCFCDPHAHVVFPFSTQDWVAKSRQAGTLVQDIRSGAGLRLMSEGIKKQSEEELLINALDRIDDLIEFGTGALQIKSGFGLDMESELKVLRVIRRLKEMTPITIRAIFMGANAVPDQFQSNTNEYVKAMIEEHIPNIVENGLASHISINTDPDLFSSEQINSLIEAATLHGLYAKIDGSQYGADQAIKYGLKHGVKAMDHLNHIDSEDIEMLKKCRTMPTILPGASFFLNTKHAPSRQMIDAGISIALASGYHPNMCPTSNMKLIQSIACIQQNLSVNEAINATTLNSAYAMGICDGYGSIARGKSSNVFITKEIPNINYFIYSFGEALIDTTILNSDIFTVRD